MVEQALLRTVLVVDDEPSVRRLMRRLLTSVGYHLLEAPNGIEALQVAHLHQEPIDLLLTDIVMPRMDGFALASKVTSGHPETRVLFITGQAADRPDVEDSLRQTRHAFLLKPFTSSALTQKMDHLLLTRGGVGPVQPPAATRFIKVIPVLYRPAGYPDWLRGLTVNISDSGILLEAVSELSVGLKLDLTLEVSASVGGLEGGTLLRHGRVVRNGEPTRSIPYPVGVQFI